MRKLVFIVLISMFFGLFSLCAQQSGEIFYYSFDEKIFLNQISDKIFLRFTPNTNEEQSRTVIANDVSLQITSSTHFENGSLRSALIEVQNGRHMSLTELEAFRSRPEVVSAEFLYQYNGGKYQALTNEFMVRLKETTSHEQLRRLAEENNTRIGEENRFVRNQFKLYVSKTSELNAMQMANLFFETGLFEWAAPNLIVLNAFDSAPRDPFFPHQWALRNTGQFGGTPGIDIDAVNAWSITQGDPSIRVAIVDTGVDLAHPDLQANIVSGFDAQGGNLGGAPLNDGNRNNAHGTAVAGIVAALQNNRVDNNYEGISGVAPNVKIIPIRANYLGIHMPPDLTADAINWAWRYGNADVINCSWSGGSANPAVIEAINDATTYGRNGLGSVVVFSAGNSSDNTSSVNFPAWLPNVIAVGAISPCGERKTLNSCDTERNWNSNHGWDLDVVAPGVLIATTDLRGAPVGYNPNVQIHREAGGNIVAMDFLNRNYTTWFNGTSAAAPHVSGIAALILSVNPDLTWQQVKNIIERTARIVREDLHADESGLTLGQRTNGIWNREVGYGLVNAYAAVRAAACVATFTDEEVSIDREIVACDDLEIGNVTITNGATLTLIVPGELIFVGDVNIESGELVIE